MVTVLPPKNHLRKERTKLRLCAGFVIVIIVCAFLLSTNYNLTTSIRNNSTVLFHNDQTSVALVAEKGRDTAVHAPKPDTTTESNALLAPSLDLRLAMQEEIFKMTLYECTGKMSPREASKPCLRHIPDNNQGKQRIVVLSTMDNIAREFASNLNLILSKEYPNSDQIEITHSNHVPPYGYGKNHGWTKIVRLVHLPLMIEVGEAAIEWSKYQQNQEKIIVTNNGKSSIRHTGNIESPMYQSGDKNEIRKILSEITQQVIRWHCRLSHVSAHTALFTFYLPLDIHSDRLKYFLQFIMSEAPEEKVSVEENVMNDFISKIELQVIPQLEKIKQHLIQELGTDDIQNFVDILANELKTTKNLTKWPCLSFWNVGTSQRRENMSDVSKSIAKAYSPNCRGSFVKCSVARDTCEEKGDPIC